MKKYFVFVFLLTFVFSLSAQEVVYDFNDLSEGDINGQDGWSTVVNSGGSPNEMDVANVYLGVASYDGSKAVFYGQSGGNYGRTASRETMESYPFDFTLGGPVEIQVDIHTGYWGTLFGFGYDANDNGYLMKAQEQVINIEENEGGFGFHLGDKDLPQIKSFFMPDGSTIEYTFPLATSSSWHRYKLFLDLDANGGTGSITMFVADMEGDYVAVSEISDLNLGMTPGSGTNTDPAMWTKIFLHATGGTSGFDNLIIDQPDTGGLLYQYITFNPLPDHLSTDVPFTVSATSNQGLDLVYEISAGPATISGNTITLTGEEGTVSVTASQPGNSTVAPADDVTQSFEVYNPLNIIPELKTRNAVQDEVVMMPDLMDMTFIVSTEIEHPELLNISDVEFSVGGDIIKGIPTSNGFFIGNWTPPNYGTHTLTTTITSSGGVSSNETIDFEVVEEAPSMDVAVLDAFDFTGDNSIDTTFTLPSFAGTYTSVKAVLNYGCPCDPWDRIAHVEIRGANGHWMELFKYVTPYGVSCDDEIDITDFISQLQGQVDFRINFPQSSTSITFVYEAGTPDYKFSWMDNLWQGLYPFGDYANLQPVEPYDLNFGGDVEKAYLRLLSGGFSWGETNTDNAAEFYDATHNININGSTEFQQHLWQTCNPNPVDCQPQNGTWYHNRHGWCPGSIPILFRYDLTPWISMTDVNLQYEFYPGYVDLCHPNHPNCVSGTTCSNCNDTWNPEIHVGGALVTFSNEVIISAINDLDAANTQLLIEPNPSNGIFNITSIGGDLSSFNDIEIYNLAGVLLETYTQLNSKNLTIDLSKYSSGVYFMLLKSDTNTISKKLIIQ